MSVTRKPARRLLDVDAAAAHLGVNRRYVRRMVNERRIRHFKVGALVRFDEAELDAYLDAGMREVARP